MAVQLARERRAVEIRLGEAGGVGKTSMSMPFPQHRKDLLQGRSASIPTLVALLADRLPGFEPLLIDTSDVPAGWPVRGENVEALESLFARNDGLLSGDAL